MNMIIFDIMMSYTMLIENLKGIKMNKYNFKYLEENRVVVKIPTLNLVHDFLEELSKYKNTTIKNLGTHGLEFFETDEYFMLYEEPSYDSCNINYIKKHKYKVITWDDIIYMKQENKIDEYIDEQTRTIYVYQYCIMSGAGTYNTGFVERFDRITSSKEALEFKKSICRECDLDADECSLINLNIIGERDE